MWCILQAEEAAFQPAGILTWQHHAEVATVTLNGVPGSRPSGTGQALGTK